MGLLHVVDLLAHHLHLLNLGLNLMFISFAGTERILELATNLIKELGESRCAGRQAANAVAGVH
jgi:hypothetical protein